MSKDFLQVLAAIIKLDADLGRKATNQEVVEFVLQLRNGERSCSFDTITRARKHLELKSLIGENHEPKLVDLGRTVLEAVAVMVEVNGGQAALEKSALVSDRKINLLRLKVETILESLPEDSKLRDQVIELRNILLE